MSNGTGSVLENTSEINSDNLGLSSSKTEFYSILCYIKKKKHNDQTLFPNAAKTQRNDRSHRSFSPPAPCPGLATRDNSSVVA